MNIYNTQRLLFDQTEKILSRPKADGSVPDSFYTHAYALLEDIEDVDAARSQIENLIAGIDVKKIPLYKRFANTIQLAKADIIPICMDSVETSFQALHFDMGQPFISAEAQTMYLLIGLYFPQGTMPGTAKTRVLTLRGLVADKHLGSAPQIEEKILRYVQEYGDGWDDINTHRISCFARIVDALSETTDLNKYRDKTMAEWFADAKNSDGFARLQNEYAFYKKRGIDLEKKEVQITLEPGQLLVIDNMRAVHGRIGKRREQEVYQLMYGVHHASVADIDAFRKELSSELVASVAP